MIKYFLENWCLISFILLHTVIVSMLVPKVILQRRESGATLGACPRIGISSQIEAFWKNKHRHILDIPSIVFSK